MFKWLLQEGSNAKKHQEWPHPCTVFLIHYIVVTISVVWAHDYLLGDTYFECLRDGLAEYHSNRQRQVLCAIGTGIYAILQLGCRLWNTSTLRTSVLYEGTWLCNTTLVVGSLSLWFRRPMIAAAFCLTVGIDQLLWYVDVMGWLLTGRFVIGVAKYLTWPSTPWATRFTCTHHLWTIPLFLGYAMVPLSYHALVLSALIMILHVIMSRFFTPFHIDTKYLNVNLAHELWKDISFGFLQISKDKPPAHVYMARLLLRWQAFNVLVFLGLVFLRQQFVDDNHPRFC